MFIIAGLCFTTACASYLDVVPDDVATIDHAFSTRNTTERFLGTCYWYLPDYVSLNNLGLIGADELWWNTNNTADASMLAKGNQNSNDPYLNFWDGSKGGKNMFTAIRDCNIFLENVYSPGDIEERERKQWIAEVKTLKAYFHFYLMQLYGPIPIIRENLPINADIEEVRVYREPVDDVANYIAELIDEALPDLLESAEPTRMDDAGRITQPVAAAIKAKALALVASPLFNGKENEAPQFSLVDNRGIQLFPREYKVERWTKAAEAARQAIEISHRAGHRFYEGYTPASFSDVSPKTRQKFTLRAAVLNRFNREIIWSSTRSTYGLQMVMIPYLGKFYPTTYVASEYGPTLKIAEEFYTRNGIPIDEDREWRNWAGQNFVQRYEPCLISPEPGSGIDGNMESSLREDHIYDISAYTKLSLTESYENYGKVETSGDVQSTARLHFYREPRFYAWIGFDRGIWEMGRKPDSQSYVILTRAQEGQGYNGAARHMTCGYFAKKLVYLESDRGNETSFAVDEISCLYPIIRLSDLYLLYAEALNESKQTPDAEVYRWIDSVRLRAGLEGVVQSWDKYAVSTAKNKPLNKEGMRDIIKRERLIELSFEGQRLFDLLRWKDALQYFNEPVQGWNLMAGGGSAGYDTDPAKISAYYTVTTFHQRVFNSRDYLWPIKLSSLRINTNLKQNPGWEAINN
jgi:hypothetical protein